MSVYRGWRRNGKIYLFIGDYVEVFYVLSPHQEFLWVCDYFVVDSDRGGRIEEFDVENSMFHWKIDGILWLRATECDGDLGGIAIGDMMHL